MSDHDALLLSHVTVRFGGTVAVNRLSLRAPVGRISGLIGPNGAGKTTTFNVCSGLLSPSEGTVDLFGRRANRMAPPARARLGLGRTFQRMELFDSLTVRENVALGAEAARADLNPVHHLVAGRAQRRAVAERSQQALERCGIDHLAAAPVGTLSTGLRRLVELARVVAGEFRLLLLDEPASGLDRGETEKFAQILRDTVATTGVGILLVEHDVELVMATCSYVYVLDFGTLIFEGDPEATRSSDAVKQAYLGVTA